jgi:hypothetical protein
MRLLVLKTDETLSRETAERLLKHIEEAKKIGILLLDGRWNYEIIEIEDVM